MPTPSVPAADVLVVPARFTGPPASGNGGWVAGAVARLLPDAAAVTVRLSAPPPLDVPLDVAPDGDGLRVTAGDVVVATARPVPAADVTPHGTPDPFVPLDAARAAAAGYPGAQDHPFPSCFVCSPVHPSGLRLTPAVPPGGAPGTVATPWVPDGSLDDGGGRADAAAVWAALDCPGGWASDIPQRPMVLGTVTGTVLRRPAVGEPCVVTATARGGAGRTVRASTTLWSADGERLAGTAQVWVVVDPESVRPR